MSNTLEYILSLKDKFSAVTEKFNSAMKSAKMSTDKVNATTSKVTGAMSNGWSKATTRIQSTIARSRQLGTSLESLQKKLAMTQSFMSKTTDKNAFRYYYNEAKRLEKQIRRLEQGISGGGPLSKIKGWGKDFISAMPGASVLTNPITAMVAGLVKLRSFLKESKQAYIEEAEQLTKLRQVMGNTMGARSQEVDSIRDLMQAQQNLGVISTSVQSAGSQELATYLSKTESLKKLMPVMNDMLAQQYGMNASQEQAINVASMMGKVMDGQVGALSRYGYRFSEAQEKILKYGTEAQRAATLADVISDSVGGVNEALANTPEGKLKKAADKFDMIKVRVGQLITVFQTSFSNSLEKAISLVDKIVAKFEQHQDKIRVIIQIISTLLGKAISGLSWILSKVLNVVSGLWNKLKEGNPVIVAITTVVSSFIAALISYQMYLGLVSLATSAWSAATAVLNAILAINPVILIIAGIIALIAIISYLIYKIDGWGEAWSHVVNAAKNIWEAFVNFIKAQFTLVVEGIMIGIDQVRLAWAKFQKFIGKGDEGLISSIEKSIAERAKLIEEAGKDVRDSVKGAWDDMKKAGSSLSWNSDKGISDVITGIKAKFGIADPTGIPGTETTRNSEIYGVSGNEEATKTNSAIATGGTRHNYITINLNDLIGHLTIHGKTFKETTSEMEDQVLDAMLRVIGSATTAGG